MTPSKARRVTQLQQEKLLQFMQENPEFAARRATNPLNRAHYDQKWEELAITLNGGGEGSQKSVAEWRKVGDPSPLLPRTISTWSDWRKNVRLKATGSKDGEGKPGEGSRKLSGVERRLLELVGTGTPPKQANLGAITPVTVTSTVAATRPTVDFAIPQPMLPTHQTIVPTQQTIVPTQQTSTNFSSTSTNVFPARNVCENDVEVLAEVESDHENSHPPVSKSKDVCQSQTTSPHNIQYPRPPPPPPPAEANRVGVPGGGVDASRGVRRPSSLEERRLALEERRLLLDERRLKLEERRVQHEEWRAAMERQSHDVDMDMKRALLKHMRRYEPIS